MKRLCVLIPFDNPDMANKAADEVANQLGYACTTGEVDYEAAKAGTLNQLDAADSDKFIEAALNLEPNIQKRLYKLLHNAGNRI